MADYEKLEATNVLKSDPNQREVVGRLQELQDRLRGYQAPGDSTGKNFFSKVSCAELAHVVEELSMKGVIIDTFTISPTLPVDS